MVFRTGSFAGVVAMDLVWGLFSVLLLITEGRRGFAELSLPRSGAWGAPASRR